jgi:hypothetical protein
MNMTPSGNISAKVAPGRTYKRRLKIEKIARLTAAGYTDQEIAFSVGIGKVYVSMLRRTPEYIAILAEVNTGVISEIEGALREEIQNTRAELKSMLPSAILALRDALLDKSNPRLRLEAAKEILDREGSIVKISKTEVKLEKEVDFTKQDATVADILAALSTTAHDTIMESGTEFISTSVDEETQEKLHAKLDLAALEPETATLQ